MTRLNKNNTQIDTDVQTNNKAASEARFATVTGVISVLSVLLSLVGLFLNFAIGHFDSIEHSWPVATILGSLILIAVGLIKARNNTVHESSIFLLNGSLSKEEKNTQIEAEVNALIDKLLKSGGDHGEK